MTSKPKYLGELLFALQSQTLPPTRVLFSDDSPDQAFVQALGSEAVRAAYPALRIEVMPGPRQGAWANFQQLLRHYRGDTEFFHLQLDDDIWVVHAFQKKSKSGIATPKQEIDLVRERIKRLKEALQ